MTLESETPVQDRLRMLVVESDPAIRSLLRTAGRREGFDVVEAARGGEAIEILSTCSFDVIVLDLVLPRVRGVDVLAYYHGRYPGRRNAVILSAGGAAPLQTIAPAEVFAVLREPLTVAAVRAALRECVRQQRVA